ncbi:O-antigen ligase family protein [Peribacillus sp. NPDC101481]|uniref:O-antigen ligase family protein n=1 Tax=Peribacillus sp. NPDC101481 TaxID=3364403 RepID=UPI00381284D7
MKLFLLLPLLAIFYIFIISLYSRKKFSFLNGVIVFVVFLAFSSNIQFNIVIFNQSIYLSLLTFINLTIIWAFITVSVLIKQKNIKLSNNFFVYNSKKMKFITFLFFLMILVLIVQLFFIDIYDYNLYLNQFNLLVNLFLLGMVIYILSANGLKFKQILISIVVFSLFNSVLGFIQYIFNSSFLPFSDAADIFYTEGRSVIKRAIGIVGASNGAGNLAAILMPILILYFLKYNKKIGFIAILTNLIFCVLTFTRLGYLAIFIELILCFLLIRSKDKLNVAFKIFLALFLMGIFGLVIFFFFDDIYKTLIVDRGDTQSSRFIQFEYIKLILADLPILGIGAGQYTYYLSMNYYIIDIAIHSQLLNILVEQGIINFILFITLLIYLIFKGYKNFSNNKWFLPTLISGYIIVSNFNPNQYYAIPNYILFIMLFSLVFIDEKTFFGKMNKKGKYENV